MTSHPGGRDTELPVDTIAEAKHICHYIHLPCQSGSSRVLKAMNRHYDREKYLDLIRYAKEKMPDLSLTSDIIVGFPGETYEEFCETLSLIREVEFTSLFTFIFLARAPAREPPKWKTSINTGENAVVLGAFEDAGGDRRKALRFHGGQRRRVLIERAQRKKRFAQRSHRKQHHYRGIPRRR